MGFYDFYFRLSRDGQLRSVEWGDPHAREMYHLLFSDWLFSRRTAAEAFAISPDAQSGTFFWDEDTFLFQRLPAEDEGEFLLVKKCNDHEQLLTAAMDHILQGIQVYDKNACAVYFNKSSRKISHIPDDLTVEGRHLLDIYELDENISTVMTSLRTRSPVINRVDHYKSSDGISIATANTAYPVLRGRELIGSVVFEQSSEIVDAYARQMGEIDRALKQYSQHTESIRFAGYTFEHIIGHGEKLQEAVELAQRVAPRNSSILLVGETGTGKEVFAQSIHRASQRREKKFVALNCAAIPETLIESLLFGSQKGAFTGSETKPGYFEEAEGGTLFLDELNSMSLSMQSKILRAIQEQMFRRVGGQKDIPMDVRIISSCNEDPFQSVAKNELRKDLFYRLSTVMIELPPLREHLEDLDALIDFHLQATSFQFVRTFSKIDGEVRRLFRLYSWPGNVRELFHVLDYAQNVTDGDVLTVEHLPGYLRKLDAPPKTSEAPSGSDAATFPWGEDLQSIMDTYEHKVLREALAHYGYNISKTADALGLRRQSLQYRIKKYGIII